MTSFYSFNIHSQGIKNPTALIEHVIKTRPRWLLTMDGLALAQQLKAASPTTNVIHRNYGVVNGDGDSFARFSPQTWLDLHKPEIEAGVWLMTTCEPGWGQDVIDWHVSLMKLCITRQIHLVVGNFSVGTPDVGVIGMAKPMLQLLADHPDLFVLGLHEYANAVITSGFVGGAPNGWTESHDKQHHPDYTLPSSWPLNGEAKLLTKWHMGRFQFIVDYCKSVGIKPPRIVLTETGFDDVSDIKWWTNTLPRTEPYTDIRGYKTLQAYWKQVFPQWSHDQAYFKQLEYAENNIYNDTVVEGGLIYCYGHKSDEWQPFDCEGRTELLGYLEADTVPLTPNYIPAEFVAHATYKLVIAGTYRNLREQPSTSTGKFLGQVDNGATVTALEQRVVDSDYWWKISIGTLTGWVSLDGGRVELRRVIETPPVIVTPPPVIVPPVVTDDERLNLLFLTLSQTCLEISNVYRERAKKAA